MPERILEGSFEKRLRSPMEPLISRAYYNYHLFDKMVGINDIQMFDWF